MDVYVCRPIESPQTLIERNCGLPVLKRHRAINFESYSIKRMQQIGAPKRVRASLLHQIERGPPMHHCIGECEDRGGCPTSANRIVDRFVGNAGLAELMRQLGEVRINVLSIDLLQPVSDLAVNPNAVVAIEFVIYRLAD
ncbi:MAG: hypothetical protein ABSC63_09120 [Candidatus Binataceae bacterium]